MSIGGEAHGEHRMGMDEARGERDVICGKESEGDG